MDPVEKAKGEMGAIERAFYSLPGIEGYKNKEMRRDADRKVRDALAKRLEEQRRRVTALQHDLLAGGGLLWMDDLERVVGRLQLLIDRVRTAAYGYAPFFDLQRVREEELDRLVNYDKSLFDTLPKLEESIGTLQTAIGENAHIQEAIQALADLLAGLNETFGRRAEAMRATE
jgi:hypothetical protein